MQLTANEVSLICAFGGLILSGVVSFLVAVYTVRHSANYEAQIQQVYEVLASLAQTQERFREQHEQLAVAQRSEREIIQKQAEAAAWRPKVQITSAIEGNEQVNKLILKSPQEFRIHEIGLISASGAKLHEYPVMGSKVYSTGFSVHITHASLILIANSTPSFFLHSTFEGKLRYCVERKDGVRFEGELPFRGESVIVHNTQWFKLTG